MGLTKPRAAQIFNLDYKQSTRVVTATNITLSGGAPNAVDGVNLSLGDRVLVTGQTTGSQNGLYQVTTLGSGANGTWARTSDGNENGEIEAGMIVMVTEGTIYADTQWKLITDDPIVINTTALTFTQNYMANSISAGSSNIVIGNNANVTISSAGTANVLTVSNTAAFVSGVISATGNISGNYIFGNGASLTGVITSVANINNGTSNVTVVSSGGNVTVGVGGTGNVAVFSSTGANITGTLSVTGAVIANSTLAVLERITVGSGGANAGIRTGAGSLTVPAYSFGIDTDTGLQRITTNQLGIVAGGTNAAAFSTTAVNLNYDTTVTGNLTVTGNVSGGNLNFTGNIVDTGPLSIITSSNGNIDLLPNGTGNVNTSANVSVTGQVTTTGNITGGNSLTAGLVSATGNVTGGNILTAGLVSATGNVTGGNILTAGLVSATGNVTGGNILGNGAGLSGINVFSNVTVTGGNSAVADSIADTLTLTAGTGIAIVVDSATDTITIAASGGSEIFVDGADFGTVTEPVTLSDDLGLVTDAVTAESDLGLLVTSGLIYPDQFVLPSYTTSTLPSASVVGAMIYVTNETGGPVPAFADGTNWRRVTDRAIVT